MIKVIDTSITTSTKTNHEVNEQMMFGPSQGDVITFCKYCNVWFVVPLLYCSAYMYGPYHPNPISSQKSEDDDRFQSW
jgi:hypothetical protein